MSTGRQIWRDARRRALQAHALRADGLSYRAIGEQMGIGRARARELALKGLRIVTRDFQHIAEALEELQIRFKQIEFAPSAPDGGGGEGSSAAGV